MLSLDIKAEDQERNQGCWNPFQDVSVLGGEGGGGEVFRTKLWCLAVGKDKIYSIYRGWVRTRYTPYANVEEMAKTSHSYMEGKGQRL